MVKYSSGRLKQRAMTRGNAFICQAGFSCTITDCVRVSQSDVALANLKYVPGNLVALNTLSQLEAGLKRYAPLHSQSGRRGYPHR